MEATEVEVPRAEQLEAWYGPIVATVNSRTAPGNSYTVRSKNGTLSCTCQYYMDSRGRPRRCRHTDVVARNLEAESQSKDRATIICEELLDVIGHSVPPGTLQRMAGCLRPYLAIEVRRTGPSPTRRSNNLLTTGGRLITLDD
jgi:hypothetical protein